MTPADDSNTLKTTTTSIEVLQLLEELDGARVSEIADRLDMPKGTVHGHLATLLSNQFVIQRGDCYDLGPELLRLGNRVRTREKGYVLAREYTERLFEETGLRSIFAVEMEGRAVFVHTASGNKMGWTHERLGNQLYLHDTAVGKAILAELPRHRVDQILDKWGTPRETDNTITDREALFSDLEEIRERGYALNRAENFSELYAVGVAATKQSGEVIGAFSVTGPRHSVLGEGNEPEIASMLEESVEEYELELALA